MMNVGGGAHVLFTMVLLTMVVAAPRTLVLASATSVALVMSVPAFAQSNSRSSATVARQYVPAVHIDTEHGSPPPNFIVTPQFRPVVSLMLRRSQTFRRQCQRIAHAPHVTVALQRARLPMPGGVRARTQMVRADAGMYAAIHIPALDDDVELIAHEVEHIIEQLDEIDLAAAASRTNTGVVASAKDQPVFETRRATQVGLNVAREVRRTDR